jgi:hypothetical protein
MILELEVQSIKKGLGQKRTGAEITLSDEARPKCLVPFSFYIGDADAWEQANGCKLDDIKFQPVRVLVTEMAAANMGAGIKLQGEMARISAKPANKPAAA